MATVVVYTQPGCVTSQVWLEMLRARGVQYTQKNVGTDPAAAAEWRGLGGLGTPATLVEGTLFLGAHPGYLDDLAGLS